MFRWPWSNHTQPDQQEVLDTVRSGAEALKRVMPGLDVQLDEVKVLKDKKMPPGAFAAYSWDPVARRGTMYLRESSARVLVDQRAGRIPTDPNAREAQRLSARESGHALLHELLHGSHLVGEGEQWSDDMAMAQLAGRIPRWELLENRDTVEAAADLGAVRLFDAWAPEAGLSNPAAPIANPDAPFPLFHVAEDGAGISITGYWLMRTYLGEVVDLIDATDGLDGKALLRDVVAGPHGHALSVRMAQGLLEAEGVTNPTPAMTATAARAFAEGLHAVAQGDFNGGEAPFLAARIEALATTDKPRILSALRQVKVRSQVDAELTAALQADCRRVVAPVLAAVRHQVAAAARSDRGLL